MPDGVDHLASLIAAHLREWDSSPAFVELAIYRTDDATAIARAIDRFCAAHLGAPVARGLFHQSSIGCVTGVMLADGRSVVVKAHQPNRSSTFLAEIVRVQRHLAAGGLFATAILAGPLPLGDGLAIVEAFDDRGRTADVHDPEIRRALAHSLHKIVRSCEPLVAATSLPSLPLAPAEGALWPPPHSRLFDFEATAAGAEWIDAVAALARERLAPAGRRVIGHSDWRQEHVRFVGREPVVAFDWDSLCCDREPTLLGTVAHAFCADWSRADHRQAPTLVEARAFIGAYEEARGAPFSAEERRLCGACFAYSCAYTARCGHALGTDERSVPGTFQHLVWSEQPALLDL